LLNPYYTSILLDDVRTASLKRFSYEIIYRVDVDKKLIRVIAFSHQKRHPDWFKTIVNKP